MAQWLRALAALPKILSSIPSNPWWLTTIVVGSVTLLYHACLDANRALVKSGLLRLTQFRKERRPRTTRAMQKQQAVFRQSSGPIRTSRRRQRDWPQPQKHRVYIGFWVPVRVRGNHFTPYRKQCIFKQLTPDVVNKHATNSSPPLPCPHTGELVSVVFLTDRQRPLRTVSLARVHSPLSSPSSARSSRAVSPSSTVARLRSLQWKLWMGFMPKAAEQTATSTPLERATHLNPCVEEAPPALRRRRLFSRERKSRTRNAASRKQRACAAAWVSVRGTLREPLRGQFVREVGFRGGPLFPSSVVGSWSLTSGEKPSVLWIRSRGRGTWALAWLARCSLPCSGAQRPRLSCPFLRTHHVPHRCPPSRPHSGQAVDREAPAAADCVFPSEGEYDPSPGGGGREPLLAEHALHDSGAGVRPRRRAKGPGF
uniref:Bm403207 n=1 Tax=Rattus norvegicus TaxID=10116 RepID=Q7TP00_RAT|nr:Bm403207 [Rattus norvegicus]